MEKEVVKQALAEYFADGKHCVFSATEIRRLQNTAESRGWAKRSSIQSLIAVLLGGGTGGGIVLALVSYFGGL